MAIKAGAEIVKKIYALLKQAGIDTQKIIGTVGPNITKLVTKTQETARKPKLIDALHQKKATHHDSLDIFKNDAKYLSQMNEMELVNFANNLDDYFKVGGKFKFFFIFSSQFFSMHHCWCSLFLSQTNSPLVHILTNQSNFLISKISTSHFSNELD